MTNRHLALVQGSLESQLSAPSTVEVIVPSRLNSELAASLLCQIQLLLSAGHSCIALRFAADTSFRSSQYLGYLSFIANRVAQAHATIDLRGIPSEHLRTVVSLCLDGCLFVSDHQRTPNGDWP
jgi:hypothetical protein